MKKIIVSGMAALFALAVVTTAAVAERRMGPPDCDRMGPPCGPMGAGGDREGGRAKMEEMMVKMLGKRLELDSATAKKLGEIIQKNMRARDKAMREMRRATEDLEELLADEAPDNQIAAQVKLLKEKRQAMGATQEQLFDQVQSLLGARKTAQFIVLQQQMMERMRDRVREHGQQGSRGPQQGRQSQRGGNASRGGR